MSHGRPAHRQARKPRTIPPHIDAWRRMSKAEKQKARDAHRALFGPREATK